MQVSLDTAKQSNKLLLLAILKFLLVRPVRIEVRIFILRLLTLWGYAGVNSELLRGESLYAVSVFV